MHRAGKSRAAPAGRFLRVLLPLEPDSVAAVPDPACGEVVGERRERAAGAAGWRQRAGVRQLPAGDLLTLEEGYHRAFVVGDLDLLRHAAAGAVGATDGANGAGAHGADHGEVMGPEEAWGVCASRDAQFPFLLAAYQHFARAGWRVSSGLKYGATYLLYGDDTVPVQHAANSEDGNGATGRTAKGTAHGHAPFAVYVLPPRAHCTRSTQCATTRKRGRGNEALNPTGGGGDGGDGGGTVAAVDGSEATETWTDIQSFTRLAAHVSKRFIVAYASYSSLSGGANGESAAGAGGGGHGAGNGDSGEGCKVEERGGGIVNLADMDRIKIRELHLNRWLPAQMGGGVVGEALRH